MATRSKVCVHGVVAGECQHCLAKRVALEQRVFGELLEAVHTHPSNESRLLFFAIPVPSAANLREHWRTRHTRVKGQRSFIFYALQADVGRVCPWHVPLRVDLVRVNAHPLDSDNLAAAFKAFQDGIADYLAGMYGRGQDRQEGLAWTYAQRAPGARGIAGLEMTFTPLE
jgi:hypothetical protein